MYNVSSVGHWYGQAHTSGSSILAAALATRNGPLSIPSFVKISPKTLTALIEKEDVVIPLIERLELIQEPDGSPYLPPFNVDYSRNNVGMTFNLEPRFLSRTQFASRTGLDVPMAGAYGLE